MLLFLLLFDLAFSKGLSVNGSSKPKCKRKNFKGRLIENCSVSAPPTTQHLVTPSFPQYFEGKITSTFTINCEKGNHIRLIFEVIDVPCKQGYIMLREGDDQSSEGILKAF